MNRTTGIRLFVLGMALTFIGIASILSTINFSTLTIDFDFETISLENATRIGIGAMLMYVGTVIWLSASQKMETRQNNGSVMTK